MVHLKPLKSYIRIFFISAVRRCAEIAGGTCRKSAISQPFTEMRALPFILYFRVPSVPSLRLRRLRWPRCLLALLADEVNSTSSRWQISLSPNSAAGNPLVRLKSTKLLAAAAVAAACAASPKSDGSSLVPSRHGINLEGIYDCISSTQRQQHRRKPPQLALGLGQ